MIDLETEWIAFKTVLIDLKTALIDLETVRMPIKTVWIERPALPHLPLCGSAALRLSTFPC